MRTVTQVFAAGESHRWQIVGSYFRLMEIDYPEVADIKILRMGATKTEAQQVDAGYSYKSPENFDGIEITCTNPCTVKFAVSDGSGTYDRTVGSVAISGGVSIVGGVVAETRQSGFSYHSSVTVGTAAVSAINGSAARQVIYFYAPETNSGDIFLGNSTVSLTNSALRLPPGAVWVEDKMAAINWWAVASQAGQSLRMMEGRTA